MRTFHHVTHNDRYTQNFGHVQPNKKHHLLMIVFKNGEHRTVLSSGKVLVQKTPPSAEWDIHTLFESLAFKVFKPSEI